MLPSPFERVLSLFSYSFRRYHLERSCVVDSEEAIKEADIVGVMHDVSNKYTRFKLDSIVLRHLCLYPKKASFLILNKVSS